MKNDTKDLLTLIVMIFSSLVIIMTAGVITAKYQNKEVDCQRILSFGTSGWHPDIPRDVISECIRQRNENDRRAPTSSISRT
jgi:hypothetical protein